MLVFGRLDPAVPGAKFGAVFVGLRSGPGLREPNGAGAAPAAAALPFVPTAALDLPPVFIFPTSPFPFPPLNCI